MSIYIRHTAGDDLSGTTDLYIRLSNKSKIERALLKDFLEWIRFVWDSSVEIKMSNPKMKSDRTKVQ